MHERLPIQKDLYGHGTIVQADQVIAQVTYRLTMFAEFELVDYLGTVQIDRDTPSDALVITANLILLLPSERLQLPIIAFTTGYPKVYEVMLRAPAMPFVPSA